jgi:hypothetical protein
MTLKFAARAKSVKNTPTINGEIEYDPQVLFRKYEDELKNLQAKNASMEMEQMVDNTNNTANDSGINLSEIDQKEIYGEAQSELEKYKALLLKQRDIMIVVTARLNNRDETIINLQGEIEHLSHRNTELENEVLRLTEEESTRNSENKRPASPLLKKGSNDQLEAKLDSMKDYSDALKNGLDMVINVLTKENASLDLGYIAQKLLGLQNLSHKLHDTVHNGYSNDNLETSRGSRRTIRSSREARERNLWSFEASKT